MKKSVLSVALAALVIVAALFAISNLGVLPSAMAVGPTTTSYFITAPVGSDPCENPSIIKTSAPLAITTATTTNVVTAVAGSYVTLCKFQFSTTGTNTTTQWEYGTAVSTACDTGATNLSGAILYATAGIQSSPVSNGLILRTPVSQELCVVTTGTVSLQGFVTYVQQPY